MIRHVVMFDFGPEFTPEIRDTWVTGLRGLAGRVPGLITLELGADEIRSERSWTHVLIADFHSVAALDAYLIHPLHLPLVEISSRYCTRIAAVDFDPREGKTA